tara:strand:+ start:997 stop:1146 length:150 start_codon:yes stop_codon:yes gene_type:complete
MKAVGTLLLAQLRFTEETTLPLKITAMISAKMPLSFFLAFRMLRVFDDF